MQKLKILFLAANPRDTSSLQIDEEIRAISNKLSASEFRECFDIFSAWAVRADDLLQVLNQYKPHIVHFSGHGNEQGEIILVGRNGISKPVPKQAFTSLFKALKDNIKLVIINSCNSSVQAEAISDVIDCVIGMNTTIGDQAAITFSASFYRAVGFGRTLQAAFEQGITSLLLEAIPEDSTPSLFFKYGVNPNQYLLLDEVQSYVYNVAKSNAKKTKESKDKPIENIKEETLIENLSDLSKKYKPISIIYCDIDGLLGINKVYGFNVGDAVLQVAEQLIKSSAGLYNVVKLRGDQFVIILPEQNVDDAIKVAKKCQRLMKKYSWASIAPDLYITCTYCIAQHTPREEGGEWLARAITGVKSAKIKGQNHLVRAPLALPSYFSNLPSRNKSDIVRAISGWLS
jgi:diguanylate cyclase (GGDEF)-like protein